MPRTGRPPAFDHQKQQQFLELLAQGLTIKAASRHVGVWPSTVYDKKLESPAFAAACQQAKSNALPSLLQHVHSAGSRSWRASAWLLERLRPDLFGRRVALGLDPALPKPKKPNPPSLIDRESIVDFLDRLRLLPDAQAVAKEKLAELEDQQHAWNAAYRAYAKEIDRRNRPRDFTAGDFLPFPRPSSVSDNECATAGSSELAVASSPAVPVVRGSCSAEPCRSPDPAPADMSEPNSENSDNSTSPENAQVEQTQPERATSDHSNSGLSGVFTP
jgi:hypothetical protein